MSTRRLAESVEGLNSSLALVAGNLWPEKGRSIAAVKGLNHPFGVDLTLVKYSWLKWSRDKYNM